MNVFEVKIEYKTFVEGSDKMKKIKDVYLIDAFTFTEAEATMTKIISNNSTFMQEAVIKGMKPVSINEIFRNGTEDADDEHKWYKCKILITEDIESTKKSKNVMFVLGSSLSDAVSKLKDFMADTIADWDSVAVEETNVTGIVIK